MGAAIPPAVRPPLFSKAAAAPSQSRQAPAPRIPSARNHAPVGSQITAQRISLGQAGAHAKEGESWRSTSQSLASVRQRFGDEKHEEVEAELEAPFVGFAKVFPFSCPNVAAAEFGVPSL
jgi:hypothetical protein